MKDTSGRCGSIFHKETKMGLFEDAVREEARLRLALAGPAGSGKTMSALRIAKGMADILKVSIGVIDTEKKSSA
jgi:Ni2+-binding GTPase involved in maturation of urease and hydrogenase